MIKTPTVLILGAGASKPYGFPTATELRDKILDLKDNPHCAGLISQALSIEPPKGYWEKFFYTFHHSGLTSIDAFLEHREEYLEIGKAIISYVLLGTEKRERLFYRDEKVEHWYEYLFNKIRTPDMKTIHNNQICILTYNYDRSLEEYLTHCFSNTYNVTFTEAGNVLKEMNIIHMHGSLGRHHGHKGDGEILEYGAEVTKLSIRNGINSIKIVHENVEELEHFRRANLAIANAQRIFFLGFGYDRTNLDRLHLFGNKAQSEIGGSAYQMTDTEIEDIYSYFHLKSGDKLNPNYRRNKTLKAMTVLEFLRNTNVLMEE